MIEHLGEVPIDDVFPFVEEGVREFTVEGQTYRVRLTNTRYQLFRSNRVCAACGLVGTVLMLDRNPGDSAPHFNLYGIEDGTLVLMTRDHIIPRSRGGSDLVENLRVMCSKCNKARSNNEELSLEQIKALR